MIWRLFKKSNAVEPEGEKWAVYYNWRNYEHFARKFRKFGWRTALDYLLNPILLKRESTMFGLERVEAE